MTTIAPPLQSSSTYTTSDTVYLANSHQNPTATIYTTISSGQAVYTQTMQGQGTDTILIAVYPPVTTVTPTATTATTPAATTFVTAIPPPTTTPSATNPVLPTYTPSDGGKISCPAYNGKQYTMPDGSVWAVTCYTDYYNEDITNLYTVSGEACIQACESLGNCTAAVWEPFASNGPCYMKYEVSGTSTNYDLIAFAEILGPTTSAAPTTYTPPIYTPFTYTPPTTPVSQPVTNSSAILTITSTIPGPYWQSTATATARTANPIPLPWVRCGALNHKGNTFYLRTHVIFGDPQFENLYFQATRGGKLVPHAMPRVLY